MGQVGVEFRGLHNITSAAAKITLPDFKRDSKKDQCINEVKEIKRGL